MTNDALAAILDSIWTLLIEGARDRRSPAHHPVVATIGANGRPSQRVMILRAADRASATLRFHTDSRSPKVVEIGDGTPASVLVYAPEAKVQLRLSSTARVETASPATDEAWRTSTTFARRCYMAEAAPGTVSVEPTSGLPAWIEGEQPTEDQVAPARENFAILLVSIDQIDWLHLANSGHRRAVFSYDDRGWRGKWTIP
jgi:pyridoxamine 5'-phosphate oxidase